MIKIISNKYFLFTLLFLYNCMAFAHDCSSPGDCEETAGYNAALAITGGAIALGAGLISTWMPPEIPDTPEDDFENEFGEDFDDEFSDEFDEGNEDKFDKDEFDESPPDKSFDDEFDDEFSDKFDKEFKDEFDDTTVTDKDHDLPKTKETPVKEDVKKEVKVKEETTDKSSVIIDKTQGIADTANNIKTLVENMGAKGVSVWRGILKNNHFGKATEHFYDVIKRLKSKGLTNLASKYAVKLNKLLRNKAVLAINKQTGAAKRFFRNLGNSKALGHVTNVLTFMNEYNKKTKGGTASWDVKVGAVGEETLRVLFKTAASSLPGVEVVDAALSLAGAPNLDSVVNESINIYKEGVTKVTDWVYSDHKSAYAKLNSDYDFQKKRIDKMHLSPSEKGKKLRKVWKILKKSHGL